MICPVCHIVKVEISQVLFTTKMYQTINWVKHCNNYYRYYSQWIVNMCVLERIGKKLFSMQWDKYRTG